MENNSCILCGCSQLDTLHQYHHAYLVKCSKCGFVFSKNIPEILELKKHYTNYNRPEELSPITIKRYNELLDSFEPHRKTNKLLDHGCSNGQFLACAKKRGWDVYGTEYAEECIVACAQQEIKVYPSDNLPSDFFSNQFDVITSFEVIEHINNPNDQLKLIIKVLRQGGVFYFTTPNFNSLSRYLLKEKWNVISYPEHLSYYTTATIHSLLIKYGFTKKYLITTGISLARFKQSIKTSSVPTANNNSDELLRNKTENNLFFAGIKKLINFFLNSTHSGDSLKGFYIHQDQK